MFVGVGSNPSSKSMTNASSVGTRKVAFAFETRKVSNHGGRSPLGLADPPVGGCEFNDLRTTIAKPAQAGESSTVTSVLVENGNNGSRKRPTLVSLGGTCLPVCMKPPILRSFQRNAAGA